METETNIAMQYQMQSYLRNPETPETTNKRHPNDTPITPLRTLAFHLKKKEDAKEKKVATTVAREDTTPTIVTWRKETRTRIEREEIEEDE